METVDIKPLRPGPPDVLEKVESKLRVSYGLGNGQSAQLKTLGRAEAVRYKRAEGRPVVSRGALSHIVEGFVRRLRGRRMRMRS